MPPKKKLTAAEKRKKVIKELIMFGKYLKLNGRIPIPIAAVDQSMNRTGLTMGDLDGEFKSYTLELERDFGGQIRFIYMGKKIYRKLKAKEPKFGIMEGYAYGSKWNREAAGELGGLIKYHFLRCKMPFVVVAPTSLKKFLGAKAKENILMEVLDSFNVKLKNSDEADSFVMYQIGKSLAKLALTVNNKKNIDYKKLWKLSDCTKRRFEVLHTVLLKGVTYPP